MFLSLIGLNEGASEKTNEEAKKMELKEGCNPKSGMCKPTAQGWQSNRNQSLVNSNWEKLRR